MTNKEAATIVERIRYYMEGGECWTDAEFIAMDMAIEALTAQPDDDDTISRQAAIDALEKWESESTWDEWCYDHKDEAEKYSVISPSSVVFDLPSAQPEPAIPLQWIEAQIEWLKSLDNAFSTLTALQISAMVNKWKGEQDG